MSSSTQHRMIKNKIMPAKIIYRIPGMNSDAHSGDRISERRDLTADFLSSRIITSSARGLVLTTARVVRYRVSGSFNEDFIR